MTNTNEQPRLSDADSGRMKERRRIARGISSLIDDALDLSGRKAPHPPSRVSGKGWLAYLYCPSGPGSETIHLEIRVGSGWDERL